MVKSTDVPHKMHIPWPMLFVSTCKYMFRDFIERGKKLPNFFTNRMNPRWMDILFNMIFIFCNCVSKNILRHCSHYSVGVIES